MDKVIDYGEDWECEKDWTWELRDRDGNMMGKMMYVGTTIDHGNKAVRAVDCVNALKGCPDPKGFVEAVKALMMEGHIKAWVPKAAFNEHLHQPWINPMSNLPKGPSADRGAGDV